MPARDRDLAEIERRDREEQKRLMKEAMTEWMVEHPTMSREIIAAAIKQWMDKQVQEVGIWTLRGILVMIIGLFFYWTTMHGGKP